jgi:hypothetical protein
MKSDSEAVNEQTNAPAYKRPLKPEIPRRRGEIDDQKQKVDSHVNSKMDVKSILASTLLFAFSYASWLSILVPFCEAMVS